MYATRNYEQYDEEIKKIIAIIQEYDDKFHCKIPVIVAGGISEKADIERYKKLSYLRID